MANDGATRGYPQNAGILVVHFICSNLQIIYSDTTSENIIHCVLMMSYANIDLGKH